MKIAEFLREDLILPDLRSTDKVGALREICEALGQAYPQLSASRLTETLLEREKLGSTGVGSGIAIPHGKLSKLNKLFGVFARLERPIDFEALDGQSVDLVFLLLAPEGAGAVSVSASLPRAVRTALSSSDCLTGLRR